MEGTYRTVAKILKMSGTKHKLLIRDRLLVSAAKAHKAQMHLYGKDDIIIGNRTKQKTYVAGVVANKGYVGLYTMGVYAFPQEFDLSPALRKMLKGKSCFHIKTLDTSLMKDIEQLIEKNISIFKREKWI
jgi:hypothetical protein